MNRYFENLVCYLDYIEGFVDNTIFKIKDYAFIKRFFGHCEDGDLMGILRKYHGMTLKNQREFYEYLVDYMDENEIDLVDSLERVEADEELTKYDKDMTILYYDTMIKYIDFFNNHYSIELTTTTRKQEERLRPELYLKMIIFLYCLRMGIDNYDGLLFLKERLYLSYKTRRLVMTKDDLNEYRYGYKKEFESLVCFGQNAIHWLKTDFEGFREVDDYYLERNCFISDCKLILIEPQRKEFICELYGYNDLEYELYRKIVYWKEYDNED